MRFGGGQPAAPERVYRIHFSGPTSDLGGKILVGIFVDHLDT
jgi:hypothetical protein